MKPLLLLLTLLPFPALLAYEHADFTEQRQTMLQEGKVLVWTLTKEDRMQFTCAAILLDSPLATVWALLEDKESSPKYLDGMKFARIVNEEEDGAILIYQETERKNVIPGVKYTVRHRHVDGKRVDFEWVSGDLNHIEGAWHVDEVEPGQKTLLVYELHIDPGQIFPQGLVVKRQKQRLPEVLKNLRRYLRDQDATAPESGERPDSTLHPSDSQS